MKESNKEKLLRSEISTWEFIASGLTQEHQLNVKTEIEAHVEALKRQLKSLMDEKIFIEKIMNCSGKNNPSNCYISISQNFLNSYIPILYLYRVMDVLNDKVTKWYIPGGIVLKLDESQKEDLILKENYERK